MRRIPNGTTIYKCKSKAGDAHQDGDSGIVVSSIGPIHYGDDPESYGYMVRWNDMRNVDVLPQDLGSAKKGSLMKEKTLRKADLSQFTGTETWYRHPLNPNITYTEGAQYVAEHGGAYWLLDEIVINQSVAEVHREEFQCWKLTVDTGKKQQILSRHQS